MFMVTQNLRRWRDRGAAAVEFALVVPLLILLIFGSIEFGLYVQSLTMTENAAREGVRLASLIGSSGITAAEVKTQVKAAAINALGSVGISNQNVQVTCTKPDASSCDLTLGGPDSAGSTVTVTVTATFTGVTGMVQGTCTSKWLPCVPSGLKASSYMRIE
jgi:Flp pilus assembly protein TadG